MHTIYTSILANLGFRKEKQTIPHKYYERSRPPSTTDEVMIYQLMWG